MTAPSIIAAMESPDVFGPWFAGTSWRAWKAVMKAAFALPLAEDELAIFTEIAGGRKPPTRRVKRLVVIAGRRGGKDSMASGIASFVAGVEEAHVGRLRPGELATVACIAADRDQGKIVLNYIRAMFQHNPDLAAKVTRETKMGFELDNGCEIVVATNSFRTTRGRTILLAILDECAYFRSEESSNPDVEVLRALEPGTATIPESMIVLISSPYRKSGLLHDEFVKHFGKDDDHVLVIQASSIQLNPTLDPAIIAKALEDDPAAARAEWLGEFRNDIAGFVNLELIEAAVDRGVVVRPPQAGVRYVGFADAASGVGKDSFAISIGHRDGDNVVLDLAHEIKPPFNPQSATAEAAGLFKRYGIHSISGDKYSAGFVIDAFARNGVTYKYSERDRSQIYIECLPLFTSGRARLIDSRRLVTQFASLERRTSVTGRDSVDHGREGHDDLCNAAAGVMVEVSTRRPDMIITAEILAQSRIPTKWALNRRGSPSLGGFDVYSAALRHGPRQP
jgi:hypothetical protein